QEIVIPPDQGDVVQQLDLTSRLTAARHKLRLEDVSGAAPGYQVTLRYHLPAIAEPKKAAPFTLDLAFDPSEVKVGETVTVTAKVGNAQAAAAPMVMVDLPIPAGFTLDPADLDVLRAARDVARVQVSPQSALVYLRSLAPGQRLTLRYRVRASLPV